MGTLTSFSMTAMPRTPSSPAPESASHVEASRETATERGPSGALADIPGPRPPEREGARGSIDRMRKRPSTLPATRSSPGDTRALPTGSPLAETPAIAPGHGAAASSSQAASSSAAGSFHLAVLTRLADEFRMASEREVDPDRAATLINELRRHGTRAHADAGVVPAATNDELMSHVTEEHVQAWFRAQGIDAGQAAAMRRAAFLSGLPNPSGTFLTNALQFIAAPWLSSITSEPWSGAALGLAAAFSSAPLNALQQSAVVAVGESIREHGAPVVVP
jgi:hypothetical protein